MIELEISKDFLDAKAKIIISFICGLLILDRDYAMRNTCLRNTAFLCKFFTELIRYNSWLAACDSDAGDNNYGKFHNIKSFIETKEYKK